MAAATATAPLVSVILPTRNRLELLRRAVASVRAQTEPRFELIVVDDASTDGTAAYLAELTAQEPRARILRNAVATGGGGARNEGIRSARGEWVAFIDDDDEWMPEKLALQLRALQSHAAAVACSCNFVVRSRSGMSKMFAAQPDVTVEDLLIYNWLGGASMCVCSSATLRLIGGFDAKLRAAQDLDLWVRLRQRGVIAVCAQPLVLHRSHGGPRITTDARSQYMGARRFYLKYRHLMSAPTRRHRISHSCYVMSMEAGRRLPRRVRFLLTALRNASPRFSMAYLRRSLPLLMRDVLFGRRAPGRPRSALGQFADPDER